MASSSHTPPPPPTTTHCLSSSSNGGIIIDALKDKISNSTSSTEDTTTTTTTATATASAAAAATAPTATAATAATAVAAATAAAADVTTTTTTTSVCDPCWDVLDPNPDLHELFMAFDAEFFGGALADVEVKWSKRMTLCAGVCCFDGALVSIRLSQPLLKYRPRSDMVNTLLHEMIHALLFRSVGERDRDSHGSNFLKHMARINACAGSNISVYHSFHDEVDVHRTHWWKCSGPCSDRPPYFGYVKRAMNRPPHPRDNWWAEHQATCGGEFIKVREPEKKQTTGAAATMAKKRKTIPQAQDLGLVDIRTALQKTKKKKK